MKVSPIQKKKKTKQNRNCPRERSDEVSSKQRFQNNCLKDLKELMERMEKVKKMMYNKIEIHIKKIKSWKKPQRNSWAKKTQ